MRAPAVKVSTSAGTCKPAGVVSGELERRGSAGGAVWDMPAHAGESMSSSSSAIVAVNLMAAPVQLGRGGGSWRVGGHRIGRLGPATRATRKKADEVGPGGGS